jgi:hypothetical protein
MDVTAHIQSAAAAVVDGRPVVCVGGVLAGMNPIVDELRRAGAARILLIPTSVGTGALPAGDDLDVLVHELPTVTGATAQFRQEERWFADPPAAVVGAIRTFAGDEPLLFAPLFAAVQAFGPFGAYGPRRPAWIALEDKTRVDALFDDAHVSRPPSTVVPSEPEQLVAAHERFAGGCGAVWAGDAREGFNGGGEYVRWVRDEASRAAALAFFPAHCDQVRIAPFVEGIPASVHGLVTPNGIAAYRPVELVTLRAPTESGLKFAGANTFFDPAPADRETMRAAIRSVGRVLRERVDYRGAFTIDGICGPDGWVPTECNPRPGGALGYTVQALPDIPWNLAQHVLAAGGLTDLNTEELEALVIDAADAQRWGGAWTFTTAAEPHAETTDVGIVGDERGYRRARDGEPRDATLILGPSPAGAFVRFQPDPERTPTGPSLARRAVAAFAFADREFGTRLGTLSPASAVPRN